MLLELRIQNMALIDSLELDFSGHRNGLAVFTGETGAGKSIILQAMNLLGGSRGAASWIRNDCSKAMVEALFEVHKSQFEVRRMLDENDINSEDICIIRRIVFKDGRSKFYVNDRLVTARLAGEITENLISIASQHDHQKLLVPRMHLDFLDTFGSLWDTRREYEEMYVTWRKRVKRLEDLQHREKDKEQRKDFLTYQLKEIQEVEISLPEDLELEQERNLLKSSSTLGELAGRSYTLLNEKLQEDLSIVRKNMEQVAAIDESAVELANRIVSFCYEIEDINASLLDYRNSVPTDPFRMEQINERLALLKQLQRKYGPTLEEVLEHSKEAEEELASLDSMEQELAELEKEVEALSGNLWQKAVELSSARKNAAQKLCNAMEKELVSLSFPQAVFKVAVDVAKKSDENAMQLSGIDQVEFLFTANPGEPPKPLIKVASGGELSRLMLAMKCLLARQDQVNTVVFDEVDAGIGGKAAEAVARKIAELATHHQVLCITHLPQIAAAAGEHFMVEKKVNNGRTITAIASLDKEQRIMELARMLGGESLTDQTLAFARELVETNSN